MTALLTAESRATSGPIKNEKISEAVAECKRVGISVLLPDINESESEFTIDHNKNIRFGLSAIKNVGEAAISNILEVRKKGTFKSFEDFCKRVELSTINKKTIESLIKAGSFDSFGKRASLLMSYPDIVDKVNKKKKKDDDGQSSLFGEDSDNAQATNTFESVEEFSPNEKLAFEKEFLGFYLTSHPQLQNLIAIRDHVSHDIGLLMEEKEGQAVIFGGIIETVRKILTKKSGAEMAFVTISNEKGQEIECVVFPKIFERYKTVLYKDSVLIINGKLDSKNDKPVIIAEGIKTFSIESLRKAINILKYR